MTLITLLMILILNYGGIPTCNKINKCHSSKIVVHKAVLVKKISK